jgi:hypothetical protein
MLASLLEAYIRVINRLIRIFLVLAVGWISLAGVVGLFELAFPGEEIGSVRYTDCRKIIRLPGRSQDFWRTYTCDLYECVNVQVDNGSCETARIYPAGKR